MNIQLYLIKLGKHCIPVCVAAPAGWSASTKLHSLNLILQQNP